MFQLMSAKSSEGKNLTAEVPLWEGRVRVVGQKSLARLRFDSFLPGTISRKLRHFAACLGSADCSVTLRAGTHVLGAQTHARHGLSRNPLGEGVKSWSSVIELACLPGKGKIRGLCKFYLKNIKCRPGTQRHPSKLSIRLSPRSFGLKALSGKELQWLSHPETDGRV